MEVITAENLTKVYGGRIKAVDGVSFEVDEGEIFGFLGPNGAGKTSTILILITLLTPTSGKATVCGYDVVKNPMEVRRCIGYVSQDIAVDEYLTGRENLMLQGGFYHISKGVLKQRVQEVLELVDLTDRADDLVSTYSGGMRKRLDIAEGLTHRPRILFLDEPTLGLDIQTRHKIWEYIQRLRNEEKMTIFLTTHYMDEADILSDRVTIIDYGKIKAIDKPSVLKNRIGGEVITLRFVEASNSLVEATIDRISEMSFIEKITTIRSSYNIIVKNGDTAIPKIFNAANEMGASIESISLKKPSLDDVFLAYTGRELREEVGTKEALLSERVRMMRTRGRRA